MFKNKKKLIIASIITLISIRAYAVPAIIKKYTCPIGNEKFESIEYLPQCPTNKFIVFKDNFTVEETKKYEKIINSKEYKSIPKDAPREYYLAKLYELEGNFSNKEVGLMYYNVYYSRTSNNKIISEALKKGISYLEKDYLSKNTKDDESFWKLMTLYVENKDYNKVDNYIEKLDKKNNLEKIANFYYSMVGLDDSYIPTDDYEYYGYRNKITNSEIQKHTIQKTISYINEISKIKREKLSNTELIQLARLYREINDTTSLDKLFNKMSNDYSKEIILFYLDEPEQDLTFVYTDKYKATNSDLEKALTYANKYVDLSAKSKDNYEKNMSLLLKTEIERRLGKFDMAIKTLNKVNKTEIKDLFTKYSFDRLKNLIDEKDNRVMTHIPSPVMY